MIKNSSICVLVSGGLDSDVLVAECGKRYGCVHPLYIRQGLAWEAVEIYWLRRFLKTLGHRRIRPLRILSFPLRDLYKSHWSLGHQPVPGHQAPDQAVYLPGRNLILLAKAAVFCALQKIPQIALGLLKGNPFPDATSAFFTHYQAALRGGLQIPFSIQRPYRKLSKVDVLQRGRLWPLELSFSCLAPKGRWHCGHCNKCAERRNAFRLAGIEDKTRYAYSPRS